MEINWTIGNDDIIKVKDFVAKHNSPFVDRVIERNVKRQNIRIDRDAILKNKIMCLLTSQQPSGPNSKIGCFLRLNPFPVTYQAISETDNIENFVRLTLLQNGLNRFINKIPTFFADNFQQLEANNWKIFSDIENKLIGQNTQKKERTLADQINDTFKGFGPKQSRNFLQALGLTRYEIPLDSRITSWLNDFGFPITLSSIALQDKGYYHFVSDGFQTLCANADIYPCVLDATIFSSFDNGCGQMRTSYINNLPAANIGLAI